MALKENYRELLLDAVVRVAARDGLDRTTTKLIAAEVPCNEVYIYRNFGSKDGLLQAAFNRTDMRFVQTVLKNLDVMDNPASRWSSAAARCGSLCGASAWPSRTTPGFICAIITPRSSLPAPTNCTTATISSFRPDSAGISSPRMTAGF